MNQQQVMTEERQAPQAQGTQDPQGQAAPESGARNEQKADSMKRRTFQFHMKLVESDGGRRAIEGYASTRDLDRTGEIVEPGAFAESLTEFMANPVLTYMHDWSNPIGKVTGARIDEVGLFIRANISETAEKVWKLIREGILRAFSIGYEVVEEKVIGGVNHILRLRLYEVAVVSIPANRRALFSVSKGLEVGTDLVRQLAGEDMANGAATRHNEDVANVGATQRVARSAPASRSDQRGESPLREMSAPDS
jgi:HK97 family phage prohead protease